MKNNFITILGVLGLFLVATLALATNPAQQMYLFDDQPDTFVWSEIYPGIGIQHEILEHTDMDADGTVSEGDLISLGNGGSYAINWSGDVYYLAGCLGDSADLYIRQNRSVFQRDPTQEWTIIYPAFGYHYHSSGPFDAFIEFDEGFSCYITLISKGVFLQILPNTPVQEPAWSDVKSLY
jgi:hypothetical protein